MAGPVTRTNGVEPLWIKDSIANNPFRGGVSLGGHRHALYPLSLLSGTPPATASYLLFSVLFSFPSFLSVVIFPLFFGNRIFFLRLLKCFSPALRFPDMHAYCGYLRSKRPSLGTQIGQQWLERDACLQFVLLKTYNIQIAVRLEPITLLLSSWR